MKKYFKRLGIMGILCGLFLSGISFSTRAHEPQYIQLVINELSINPFTAYDAPILYNNRVLVPLRMFFETIDAKVNWEPETQTIEIFREGTEIKMQIGDYTAMVNGVELPLDVPAQKIIDKDTGKGRTMVPLRFISDALKADVSWNPELKQVIVKSESFESMIEKKRLWRDTQSVLLVNPWNALPQGYEIQLQNFSANYYVDKQMIEALTQMFEAAKAEGLSPMLCSAYRSIEKQEGLFQRQVEKYLARGLSREDAYQEASAWVAIPGTSEHHTGLAVDIVSSKYQQLNEAQEKTKEQQWLMNNAHHYGFILRYPKDKTPITGIAYEPWHYRYVGKTLATYLFNKNLCLEEYLSFGDQYND